jgi:heat shock protein HslJ
VKEKINLTAFFILAGVLLAAGCAAVPPPEEPAPVPDTSFDPVVNRDWELASFTASGETVTIERGRLQTLRLEDSFSIQFDGSKVVSGKGAPNRFAGTYATERDGVLSISALVSTRMAALAEPEQLVEKDYFAYLQGVFRWEIAGQTLLLYSRTDEKGEIVLSFSEKNQVNEKPSSP